MKTLQLEIMKALEDAKCLDPESENWSYHTASRVAAEVASQFREPSSPDKIDEAISYFEEIKSERESKKEDDTVLINYVLIILKSIKQRSPTVKESETGEQEEKIIVHSDGEGKLFIKTADLFALPKVQAIIKRLANP